MRKSKKIISVFLSLMLIISVLCASDITAGAVGGKPSGNFITFSSAEQFTINAAKMWNGILEYSTDGSSWEEYAGGTDLAASQSGNVGEYYLYLRGTGNTQISATARASVSPWNINGTAVSCSGNIENLLNYPEVAAGNHPTLYNYCFYQMFYNCTALTEAPALSSAYLSLYCYESMFSGCTSLKRAPALPAMSLADGCYYAMFKDCTALADAPALPATNLANFCYYTMFKNCASLKYAPTLPATNLADYCYYSMFEECAALEKAPALPATTLAEYCYSNMFKNCYALSEVPVLPATTLTKYCYSAMFQGCSALTSAPALPATTLAEYCYFNMFQRCISLKKAPSLPATTLATYCYSGMFWFCTSLRTAPALPAENLANYCYANMFVSCTALLKAPVLPATSLATSCYTSMFKKCSSLLELPFLPAKTMATGCYREMFRGCTGIKLYENADDIEGTALMWSFPAEAAPAGAGDWDTDIFYETGGNFTGKPEIGTTYYYAAPECGFMAVEESTIIDVAKKEVFTYFKNSNDISDIVIPFSGYTLSVTQSLAGNLASFNGTGTVIKVESDFVSDETYTLIVRGDINGDSVCDVFDCTVAQQAVNIPTMLNAFSLKAADFDESGSVEATDLQQVINCALEV